MYKNNSVENTHCDPIKPKATQSCNQNQCPGQSTESTVKGYTFLTRFDIIFIVDKFDTTQTPTWTVGEWTSCSLSCDGGRRKRQDTGV